MNAVEPGPGLMKAREFLDQRVLRGLVRHWNNVQIARTARRVASRESTSAARPVAFFKASTGIDDLSWNSAFHLLSSWALRLKGQPVAYFACNRGMSHCVLGTNRRNVHQAPPCRSCIHQARSLYAGVPGELGEATRSGGGSLVHWFGLSRDPELEGALQPLSLAQLMGFEWPKHGTPAPGIVDRKISGFFGEPLPLGALCLPGLRWILRRQNLEDDEDTRFLLREYILSAWNVAREFSAFLKEVEPRAVVVFNGQFYPEAVARLVAQRRGVRVITHEVGLQPASAFFTDGEATAYPIRIPGTFELNEAQGARLDRYLESRFQGKFSMAGIQFWPSMRGLDENFLEKASHFRQVVPIFTNVIFDTSQPHANTVFRDMFEWLDAVLVEIKAHPDTLFVIRAHPDETRQRKESRETVEAWVERSQAGALENVTFVPPTEPLSSYELIQRAKFVMVYNSTIGLEASILGRPVLCGGKARFTQYPTAFFPQGREGHIQTMRELLNAQTIEVPAEFRRNARRFLYYQLFRTSLPFGDFLEPSVRTTQARLKSFEFSSLLATPAITAILNGLLEDGDFLITEDTPDGGRS